MNKKIQILRGISIIVVVLIHTNIEGMRGVMIRPFINFAVAMFIFLSGYLTSLDITDIKTFYIKRLMKMIVPYTIWSIIYTVEYSNYDSFLELFFTGRTCYTFYFIFIYMLLVLFTPFTIKLMKSKYSWIGWIVTPISLLLTKYAVAFHIIYLPIGLNSFLFTNWYIFYYLGMHIGNKKLNYHFTMKKIIPLLIVSIVLSIGEGVLWFQAASYDMATTQSRFTSIFTSIFSILFMCEYLEIDKKNSTTLTKYRMGFVIKKILLYLGNCSFGIYLSHILIMDILFKCSLNGVAFPIYFSLVVITTACCVEVGKKVLTPKYSWVFGL